MERDDLRAELQAPEEAECALCLDAPTDPCSAPCGHSFCRECILKALRMHPPRCQGSCPLCRQRVSVYTLKEVSSGSLLATPQVTDLYGNIFTQSLGLGAASYHFDAPEECYVSYESVSSPGPGAHGRPPLVWRLDDGSPVPARRPFTGCSWDPAARTFRGSVLWDPPFEGNTLWEYEIVFAEDFSVVMGGRVRVDGGPQEIPFKAPWDAAQADAFSLCYVRWTPPPSTFFGGVYVQGFHYAGTLEGVASYHFEAEDDCYISYANAPAQWTLDDGSPPPARKRFIDIVVDAESRTFRAAVEWEVPFQGASRWRYVIVFAEGYGSIVGGTWESFAEDGRQIQTREFGDPAEGEWQPNSLIYVRKPTALMAEPLLRGAASQREALDAASEDL